jgi:hypothetical protein
MCASSSAKEKSGKELGKGLRLVHKRPARRLTFLILAGSGK